jgi:hypothetical protein
MNTFIGCIDENMTSVPPTSGLQLGVELMAGTTPSGLLDGDIETPAGIETFVDAVLDCRDKATASTPQVSGQKHNVEHLAGMAEFRLLGS